MKKNKSIKYFLFFAFTLFFVISFFLLSNFQTVRAENSNKKFSAVSGGSVASTDVMKGDEIIGRTINITPNQEGGKVFFEYDGVFSATDMMDGVKSIFNLTLNNMATVSDKKFSILAITMEDMLDPSQQIVYSIGQYGIGASLNFFAVRIGFSDNGLVEQPEYGALYSTYNGAYIYHTALDNNATPGNYVLGGNLVAGDIRTFFIWYNNTTGNRVVSLLPNFNGYYQNNIDEQQVYSNGSYIDANIPQLFTSGYYKLKFQIVGAKSGLSFTLNGDMDSQTVPFFKNSSYNLSIMEGENVESKIKEFVLNQMQGLMDFDETPSIVVTDQMSEAVDFGSVVKRNDPYVMNVVASANGLNSNKIQLNVTIIDKYLLYDEYFVEIQKETTLFPVVEKLSKDYSYSVKLFDEQSVNMSSPLYEGISYNFSDVGKYKVVYEIFDSKLNLNNEGSLKFAELTVQDTTAPKFNFTESYNKVYNVKDKVAVIIPKITDNNPSGNPTLNYTVYVNDKTVDINDNKITIEETGIYRIVYNATDKSGNSDTFELNFFAENNDNEKPIITLKGNYKDSYNKGAKIKILDATVSDNVDERLTAQVNVMLNGVNVEIKDGQVETNEGGLLIINYSATDSYGNANILTVRINIIDDSSEDGCGSFISNSSLGLTVLSIALTSVFVYIKRKKGEM